MTSTRNAFGSPFLGETPEPERESSDFGGNFSHLLFETPYARLHPQGRVDEECSLAQAEEVRPHTPFLDAESLDDTESAERGRFAQGVLNALQGQRAPRYAAATGGAPTQMTSLPGRLWTFQASTLSTKLAVYCSKAALGQVDIDLVFYVHGLLNGCARPKHLPEGIIDDRPFRLGKLVEASAKPVVLVVPLLDWKQPGGRAAFGSGHPRWHALAKPESLNALLAEVLREVAQRQGATPQVQELVVAGHSRAYDFLEPLAYSRKDAQMRQGVLSKLRQVWAFDTTYAGNLKRWKAWLSEEPSLNAHFFYRPGTKTAHLGDDFFDARGGRLHVTRCSEGHCAVPGKRLPGVLRGLGSVVAQELWEREDAEFESFEREADDGTYRDDELAVDDGTYGDDELEVDDGTYGDDELEAESEFDQRYDDDEVRASFEAEQEEEELHARDGEEARFGDDEAEYELESEGEEQEPGCEGEVGEPDFEDEVGDKAPLAVPPSNPVPFAPEPPLGSFWPVDMGKGPRLVSYRHAKGFEGRWGGRFLAKRDKGRKRHHVGVDLFAKPGSLVVACERGMILSFKKFYKANSGQQTFRILIAHPDSGIVANYGEVTSNSLTKHGLDEGFPVAAGQPIGFVSDTHMLHFETYVMGTKGTERWYRDTPKAPPALLNPTRYLLFLRDHGRSPREASSPVGGTSSSVPTPTPTPMPSSSPKPSAELIRFAQRVLNATQRAGLDDDGKIGKLTRAALAAFRSEHGLGTGAELDETTVLALAQRALEELAQASMFAKLGVLDDRTRQAISTFRSQNGLGFDARLDLATCTALGKAVLKSKALPSPPAASVGAPNPSGAPIRVSVLPDPLTVVFRPREKKRGFEASGGERVATVLRGLRDEGLLSVADAEIELLQRLSFVESSGKINAVQTWDSAYLSFGFVQWTIKYGELQELISKVPGPFARYGIEIAGAYPVEKGQVPGIRGAARANDLRSKLWVERFYRAGFDTEIVVAQVKKAVVKERQVAARAKKILGAAYTDAFRTPLLRAFVYEAYNNRPAYLWAALPKLSSRINVFTSKQQIMDLLLAALKAEHPEHERGKPQSIYEKIKLPV